MAVPTDQLGDKVDGFQNGRVEALQKTRPILSGTNSGGLHNGEHLDTHRHWLEDKDL